MTIDKILKGLLIAVIVTWVLGVCVIVWAFPYQAMVVVAGILAAISGVMFYDRVSRIH